MKNITAKASTEINAPAAIVWNAITSPQLIKKYMDGTTVRSDWKVGSPIVFSGMWHGKTYEDKGTILEMNPYKTFRYTCWSNAMGIADRPENYVGITYFLREMNGVTNLTIAQENISDETNKSYSEENWKKILSGLKDVVETEMIKVN